LKRPRRNKSARLRQPKHLVSAMNQIWSMDFVADALFDGRRLRALTVVENYSRESLAIDVGQSLKGEDVVDTLNRITAERGLPATIKVDNGRFRQECLNGHWFLSLDGARRKIEDWRQYYNETRPHSALQWATPAEFARQAREKALKETSTTPEISTNDRY
jgi:putative transposase